MLAWPSTCCRAASEPPLGQGGVQALICTACHSAKFSLASTYYGGVTLPSPLRTLFGVLPGTVVSLLLAAALLAGCSPTPRRKSPVPSAADTLSNGLPLALRPKLADWMKVWRYAIPRFELDSLSAKGTADFLFGADWAGAGRPQDGVRSRALVDVLSPDSTHSLDFDMYLDFDATGGPNGMLEREPDSAPILADFARDSLWQVGFCGTPCSYDGAYWVDNARFALSGSTETGDQLDGPRAPFLDVYNLLSHRRTRWLGPPVDARACARYAAAADSALEARLLHARLATAGKASTASRVRLSDR